MINAVNDQADDTNLFSDSLEKEFYLVKNETIEAEKFCPIAIFVYTKEKLLHILLGDFVAPNIESEGLRESSLGKLLDLIKCQKIRKMKITSNNFNYDDKPSLSFLFALLLNIEKKEELEFFATDGRKIVIPSLNALMFAALRNPEKMRKITLSLAFYNFPHRDFIKIMRSALCRTLNLQELELAMLGKTIPFARIFSGLINGRREWTNSLQRLAINCFNFSRRATILQIFNYFPSLKHLSLLAYQIDINDQIFLKTLGDQEKLKNFETLDFSLKNLNITDYAVSQFLKRDFGNLKKLNLIFGGSSITDEAFDGVLVHGIKNFNKEMNLEFDIQDTKATQECKMAIIHLLYRKRNGPGDNEEASVKVLRTPNEYKKISDDV